MRRRWEVWIINHKTNEETRLRRCWTIGGATRFAHRLVEHGRHEGHSVLTRRT